METIKLPKYKIGDSVVIKTSIHGYKLARIISAYLDTQETIGGWKYYTSIDDIVPVREDDIIS